MSNPASLSKADMVAAQTLTSMMSKDRRQMLKIDSILNSEPQDPILHHTSSSQYIPFSSPSSSSAVRLEESKTRIAGEGSALTRPQAYDSAMYRHVRGAASPSGRNVHSFPAPLQIQTSRVLSIPEYRPRPFSVDPTAATSIYDHRLLMLPTITGRSSALDAPPILHNRPRLTHTRPYTPPNPGPSTLPTLNYTPDNRTELRHPSRVLPHSLTNSNSNANVNRLTFPMSTRTITTSPIPPVPQSTKRLEKRKRDHSPQQYHAKSQHTPHRQLENTTRVRPTLGSSGVPRASSAVPPAPLRQAQHAKQRLPLLPLPSASVLPEFEFEIGAAVQVRHLVRNQKGSSSSAANRKPSKSMIIWGEWHAGIVAGCRRMGKWVEALDSIPSSEMGGFMEYQVRISTTKGNSNKRQPPTEVLGWYRPILGDIRAIPSSPTSSSNENYEDSESKELELSAEGVMHRTMLWARFSNLFPRDEAFRLKLTRSPEGTSGSDASSAMNLKHINFKTPTLASPGRSRDLNAEKSSSQRVGAEAEELDEGENEDEDSLSDSSESYVPPSLSRKRKRSASTAKDRTHARHSSTGAGKASTSTTSSGERIASDQKPYFADIWLPFQIQVWNEPNPQGKILLPCLIDSLASSSSNSSSKPTTSTSTTPNSDTLFTPTEYITYTQTGSLNFNLARFAGSGARGINAIENSKDRSGKGKGKARRGDDESDGDKNRNGEGRDNTQWLYDATGDQFVLVEVKER